MTDFYVIRSSGSDSNGGTSEGDAFESIVTGISAAYEAGTGGNNVYVKGNGNTYFIPFGISSAFNQGSFASTVIGYGETAGDDCVGGTYPIVESAFYVNATGWSTRNFNINYDALESQSRYGTNPNWGGVFSTGARDCANLNVHISNSHSSGQYGSITSLNTGSGLKNYRLTASPGFIVKNPGQGVIGYGNGGVKAYYNGVYADLSNCTFPDHNPAYFYNFNSNAHTGLAKFHAITCIAPDPSSYPMIGVSYKYDDNNSGMRITGAIFVNCDIGIQIYSNSAQHTTQADLMSSWPTNNFIIEDCIFINCGTGIEFESGFDWPINLRNCAFYNSTTANISGSCIGLEGIEIATEDPWDSTNNQLNDYGMTLLNRQTHKGGSTSDFYTPNSDRPFYQIMGKGASSFATTDEGNLSLGTGGVGDEVTVSGRTFQKVGENPTVWRRTS